MRLSALVITVAVATVLAGCGSNDSASSEPAKDALGAVTASADLSSFATAVAATDLGSTLTGAGPVTVFAPTNAAIEALPAGTWTKLQLPCNKQALNKVLAYHVVPQSLPADKIKPSKVTTLEGSAIAISTGNGFVLLNDKAAIASGDVTAPNGVVKQITAVLLPPDVKLDQVPASC